jgi:type II secretory pathway component PulF
MNASDLIAFTRVMETLATSSIPFAKGLELEWLEAEDKRSQGMIGKILKELKGGVPLHEALRRSDKGFPGYYLALVAIGEESSRLAQIFQLLTKDLLSTQKRNREITAMLIYPVVLLVSSALALLFISKFVVPQLLELYKGFGKAPPEFTLFVVNLISGIMERPQIIFLAVFAVGALILAYFKNPGFKGSVTKLGFRVPYLKDWLSDYFGARFFLVFSVQVSGGLTVSQALSSLTKLYTGNPFFKREVGRVEAEVSRGTPLSRAMKGAIPLKRAVQYVRLGEESGNLSGMLAEASHYYEARVAQRSVVFKEALQPALLLIIGAAVGTLLITLFMPIFQSADLLKP